LKDECLLANDILEEVNSLLRTFQPFDVAIDIAKDTVNQQA